MLVGRFVLQVIGNSTIFSCDHQILCFTFIKVWQRGDDWDVYFAITEPPERKDVPSALRITQTVGVLFRTCTACRLQPLQWTPVCCSSSHCFFCNRKQTKPPVRCAPLNWVVRRLREAGRLLWDRSQPGPHTEFLASQRHKVRPCLNRQTNETKKHTAFEQSQTQRWINEL